MSTPQQEKPNDEGEANEVTEGELSDDGLSIDDEINENNSSSSTNSHVSIGIDSVASMQQEQLKAPLVEVEGGFGDDEEVLVLDDNYRISRKEELARQLMAEEERAKKERMRLLQQLDDDDEEQDTNDYMNEDRDFSELVAVRREVLSGGDHSFDRNVELDDDDDADDEIIDEHDSDSNIMRFRSSGSTQSETSNGYAQEDESVKNMTSTKTDVTVSNEVISHDPPTLDILDHTQQRTDTSVHNGTLSTSTSCQVGKILFKEDGEEEGFREDTFMKSITQTFPDDATEGQSSSKSTDVSRNISAKGPVNNNTLLENEDEIIKSNDEKRGKEKKTLFYTKLRAGFQHVAKHFNENSNNDDVDYSNYEDFDYSNYNNDSCHYTSSLNAEKLTTSSATVNFIDYTSTSTPNTMAAELKRRRAWNRDKSTSSLSSAGSSKTSASTGQHLILNLYDKVASTFQARYQSTLHSVAYNNVRTDTIDLIPRIPIRTQLMGAISPPSSSVSSSNFVGGKSLPTPISDPTEWHTGPFCHVYIAACSSQEHYRTRVRPAIQAFVSQIEGAGSGNAVAAGKASAAAVGVKSMKDGSVVAAAAAAAAAAADGNGDLLDESGGAGVKNKGGRREQVMAVSMAASQANNTAGRNYSCQYLIVVVPVDGNLDGNFTGGGSVHGSEGIGGTDSSHGGGIGLGLRGRLAAGRRALKSNHLVDNHPPIIPDSSSSFPSMNTDNEEVEKVTSPTAVSIDDSITQESTAVSTHGGSGSDDLGSNTVPVAAPLLSTQPSTSSSAAPTATTNKGPTTVITATTSTNLNSKEHRELLRKFTQDFPNGRACLLSTLLSSPSQKKTWRGNHHQPHQQHRMTHEQYTRLLKEQEWRTFLRMLGSAVVAGFNDRIKNYDEELRRLDRKRGNYLKRKSSLGFIGNFESNITGTDDQEDFNWSHYYLIKESLAFTYEQMQLPNESLREYEELEALIPVGSWGVDLDGNGGKNRENKNIFTTMTHGLEDIACGDKNLFRHLVANHNDHIRSIYYLIQQYLFMRQTNLLFMTKRPAAVVQRFGSFLRNMVRLRMDCCRIDSRSKHGTDPGSDGDVYESDTRVKEEIIYRKRAAQTEAWAVGTCWDVMSAAEVFFENTDNYDSTIMSSSSWATTDMMESSNNYEDILPIHYDMLCNICNAMNFAQVHLLRLGDLKFTSSNLIRRAMADRPEDTLTPWIPLWGKEVESTAAVMNTSITQGEGNPIANDNIGNTGCSKNIGISSVKNLFPKLQYSLYSERSFQDQYLKLTTAAIQLNILAGRHRHAMQLRADIAEVYFLRGELGLAIQNLLICTDAHHDSEGGNGGNSDGDGVMWDSVMAWRLFRLACCQRASLNSSTNNESKGVMEYLQTINHCFEPKLSSSATNAMPSKLKCLLQKDLEAIVGIPAMVNYKLDLSPFFDIGIDLTLDQATINDGGFPILEMNEILDKKVAKTLCHVGNTVVLTIFITNNLPNTIEVDSVKALLSSLEDYEDAVQDMKQETEEQTKYCNIMAEEKDAFCVFHVNSTGERFECDVGMSSVIIHPGKNSYEICWTPMSVGQYILSSVHLQWKNARFYHDPKYMPHPQPFNFKTRNDTLLGIDVPPSDPTQTIEMNPIFLIPGHVQIVRLIFCTGDDIVSGGKAELTCSHGLRMKIVGGGCGSDEKIEQWQERCCIQLGRCEPSSQIVLVVSVKSDPIDINNNLLPSSNIHQQDQGQGGQSHLSHDRYGTYYPQTLQAKVITNYHHGLYTKLSASSICPCAPPMSAALEALVTTLECPALTVNRVVAVPYAKDYVMISVTVHCNTPVSFSIKEWDIYFPHPLCLVEDNEEIDGGGGDLNNDLFEKPVVEGEEIFFGFKCRRHYGQLPNGSNKKNSKKDNQEEIVTSNSNSTRPVLHVILKDEFDKTFRQVLPLDLDDFYNSMQKEEEEHSRNSVSMYVCATLICADQQGLVGTPVSFTYRIDVTMTAESSEQTIPSSLQRQQLLYQISCTRGDWILGGKIRGAVDVIFSSPICNNEGYSASFNLEFVGVPSKAGVLKRFPDVKLVHLPLSKYNDDSTKSPIPATVPRLELRSRHPDTFMSFAYKSHMALACLSPTSIDGMR